MDGDASMRDAPPQILNKGYVTTTTNSGHSPADGTFALTPSGEPNKAALADYFFRSQHQVAVSAKKLVKAFYRNGPIAYSYFMGCSNGGRQALVAASRYPYDYDGIIAGAPAMDWPAFSFSLLKDIRALLRAHIPYSLVPQINAAVITQCDRADGVRDGLIQNPARCAFNPDVLVPSILTQGQAYALKTIISPTTDSEGKLIEPGFSVAGLLLPLGPTRIPIFETPNPAPEPEKSQPWGSRPSNPGSHTEPIGWHLAYNAIAYLGLREPDRDLNSDALEHNGAVSSDDVRRIYAAMAPGLANSPAKIERYLRMKRKLILYHGYADEIIPPFGTMRLYEGLANDVGGYDALQKNARLFMVPDMAHCFTGGSGPDVFGTVAASLSYPTDAKHDVLAALRNWVEHGEPPTSIIAAHFTGGNAMTGSVDRTMPLCPFPAEARYGGSGDVKDAANWRCTANRGLLESGLDGKQAGVQEPPIEHAYRGDSVH